MRGFVRVAAGIPECAVADFERNRESTLELWREADREGCAVVVFPELGLSAYTVRDLLTNDHLLEACRSSLGRLAESGAGLAPMAVVGLPLRVGSALYNAAAAVQGGRVLGVVPKSYLPTTREFEERRWFRPGTEVPPGSTVDLGDEQVPFGTDVLFACRGLSDLVVGVELCEDFWVQVPPGSYQVSAGATVVCNLSASNFVVGKAGLRRLLGRSSSDRGKCAYVYVAAGPGESSTDLAFDADAFVCEAGSVLADSRRFDRERQLVMADVDLDRLIHERLVTNSFGDCSNEHVRPFRTVAFDGPPEAVGALRRTVEPHPFLPSDPNTLAERCWEIFEIQTNALRTRIEASGVDNLVLGVSGGVDSTQAALVSAAVLDRLGRERSRLVCVSMPGLGTSDRTRDSAERLATALGAELVGVGVSELSRLVLDAIGHPSTAAVESVGELLERLRTDPKLGDATLENVQARLRTLVLMSIANHRAGIVVGTGDLSEKALGWATYGGDQISMYDVNAGVPKTLIRFVIRWVANERVGTWSVGDPESLREVLFEILDTPVSPELLPAGANGDISQLTEEEIGPYELHDFFLYHTVRHGSRPARVLDLAEVAFRGRYEPDTLRKWLKVFLRRFFANQFKRSCTADGPKVGMVALSPRGDWRMPSDARVDSWLVEIDAWHGADER